MRSPWNTLRWWMILLLISTAPTVSAQLNLPPNFYNLSSSAGLLGIVAGPDGALWFAETSGNIGSITITGTLLPEHPIPFPDSQPFFIAAGPDKALWFTDVGTNSIGRITTEPTSVATEFLRRPPNSFPIGITVGSDGALWFTEQNANNIGRICATPSISRGCRGSR